MPASVWCSCLACRVLVGVPLLAGLRSAGAFGDKIAPDAAFKALQEDDVVLIDIRWAAPCQTSAVQPAGWLCNEDSCTSCIAHSARGWPPVGTSQGNQHQISQAGGQAGLVEACVAEVWVLLPAGPPPLSNDHWGSQQTLQPARSIRGCAGACRLHAGLQHAPCKLCAHTECMCSAKVSRLWLAIT